MASHDASPGPGTVFVYSGQGAQWAGMGRQLLADEPRSPRRSTRWSRCSSTRLDSRCAMCSRWGAADRDRPDPARAGGNPAGADRAVALLRCGPDAVIGHSMGEVTAAVVAGALDPGRGPGRDRHPLPADVTAGRPGRDGAAGTRRQLRRSGSSPSTPMCRSRSTRHRSSR